MKNEEQEKALDLAIQNLNKEYGKGTVMRLDTEPEPWPAFSTKALSLDLALGIGGIPKGRVVEIYGPESSGKSTMALSIVAECQKNGGTAAFIDAEHAVDPRYAKALGVKLDDLIFTQPDYGEQGLQVALDLAATGAVDLIVVDSVPALVPKAELEGDVTDNSVAGIPRMMSKVMRMMVGTLRETGCTVLFTNQIREKVGVFFGSPEVQPGGRALKFACSVRIDIRRIETLKDKQGNVEGMRVRAKIVKNKMAPPLKQAEFIIRYGKGIHQTHSVLMVAENTGVVKKSGAWYAYNDENIGQGEMNAAEFLEQNTDVLEKIVEDIYAGQV